MDIGDIVTDDFEEFTPDTRVSKLQGVFDDPTVPGVIVRGSAVEGVVTRRQLATSHHPPDEKLGSLVWHVPRLAPDEDVRAVAQLMIDSDSQILPVFEAGDLLGVVTVNDILRAVLPHLSEATVAQAATVDLVTVSPESTLGDAIHTFREHSIAHLPVVSDESAVGIVSLYDMTAMTVRAPQQSQGGDAGGTDAHGGQVSASSGRARGGGYGAREGELARILDLPIEDLMVSPVRTISPEATLKEAVEEMFEIGGSSLVVTTNGTPFGIVTKTDVLESLTWEAGGNRGVQVYGTEHVDDMAYEDIVAIIDKLDDRDHGMRILDAKIHLHKHQERNRGTPLLLARIRLHTDAGLYMASGEGFGASQAINEARDVLERRIRDEKTRGRSKKHRDEEFWEKRFGWILEEAD